MKGGVWAKKENPGLKEKMVSRATTGLKKLSRARFKKVQNDFFGASTSAIHQVVSCKTAGELQARRMSELTKSLSDANEEIVHLKNKTGN